MVRSAEIGLGILLLTACQFSSGGKGGGSGNTFGDTSGSTTAAPDEESSVDGGPSGSQDGTGETGEPLTCDGGGICLPPPPPEWSGPVGVGAGPDGNALVCPGAWMHSLLANRDIQAAAAECGCDCEAPTNAQCGVDFQYFADNNCIIPILTAGGTATGDCVQTLTADTSMHVRISANVPDVQCVADPDVSVPEAGWGEQVVACTAPAGAPCGDGGSCYETPQEPLDGRFCIARAGEHGCPAGVYTSRELVYSSFNDTRGCMPCECAVTGAVTCDDAQLAEYNSTNCGGSPTLLAPDNCVQSGVNSNAWSVNFDGSQPTISCSPSAPQASGAATPAEATTLCCTA